MALIKCGECGHPFSTDVKRCPSCGGKRRMAYPLRLAIAGCVIAIFAFAMSHRSTQPPASSPANTTSATPPAPATSAAPSEAGNAYAGLAPAQIVQKATELAARMAKSNLPVKGTDYTAVWKKEVADARAALGSIADNDPAKKKAKELIATIDRHSAEGEAYYTAWLRKGYAEALETRMLGKGMSATVTAEGSGNRTLRIKYVLASKAFAYQIANQTDIVDVAFARGFTLVVFDDGFGHRFTYKPDKT